MLNSAAVSHKRCCEYSRRASKEQNLGKKDTGILFKLNTKNKSVAKTLGRTFSGRKEF